MNEVLKKLDDGRIFSVQSNEDGTFTFLERCDDYFELTLTPSELMQLTVELRTLLSKDN